MTPNIDAEEFGEDPEKDAQLINDALSEIESSVPDPDSVITDDELSDRIDGLMEDVETGSADPEDIRAEMDEVAKRNAVGHMEHLVNEDCDHDNCEALREELGIKEPSSEGDSGDESGSSGDGSDGSDEEASDDDDGSWPPKDWEE